MHYRGGCYSSLMYLHKLQDVGCVLRVTLRVNEKPYVDISNPVIPHPTTPSPRPWKHLPYRTPSMDSNQDKFRLLTWNTLADAATRNGFKGETLFRTKLPVTSR
eukprot:529935-Amorphochlora_amoeboformis.AAC.1